MALTREIVLDGKIIIFRLYFWLLKTDVTSHRMFLLGKLVQWVCTIPPSILICDWAHKHKCGNKRSSTGLHLQGRVPGWVHQCNWTQKRALIHALMKYPAEPPPSIMELAHPTYWSGGIFGHMRIGLLTQPRPSASNSMTLPLYDTVQGVGYKLFPLM